MRLRPRLFLLLVVITIAPDLVGAELCKSGGPVLTGKDGQPIWLSTEALVKRATHCVAPKWPPLLRSAQFEGRVLIDILVDDKGKVACARAVNGHPMLVPSAIDAAKDWTFRPVMQDGKALFFYGHLSFHFSTSGMSKKENLCTVGTGERFQHELG